jgi:hypothetical protein
MQSEESTIWSTLNERWAQGAIARLTPDELNEMLAAASGYREVDAGIGGVIRVIQHGTHLVLQEQTGEGELLVRRMPTEQAVEAFLAQRLEAYERLWDGCGCKIKYFEE